MIDGILYSNMIKGGAARLAERKEEINSLNVFPIPDGDTGDNMLLTVTGGTKADSASISEAARTAARGMLLSARGNSGVILSQFFEGISRGFEGLEQADASAMGKALKKGVEMAYMAVMSPTEGTILTVMREAAEYAVGVGAENCAALLTAFLDGARRSLVRTPDMLPILKQAGVVDSGGAGFICIIEGMLGAMRGEVMFSDAEVDFSAASGVEIQPDFGGFTEDSELEYGYCTELLLRLQRSKVDLEQFDYEEIRDFLETVGDSVVTVRSGSAVKIHVHTFTPHKVLEFCQRFGEFLKVKIENMSLQNMEAFGSSEVDSRDRAEKAERKPIGIVAVVSGEGLMQEFYRMGVDAVIDGGQCTNPSAEEIIEAIKSANADTVFVLPNNGNVILAAKQAAELYRECDVRVLESRSIGEGYAAISMYSAESDDADEVYTELCEAMEGVVTVQVSRCVRDASLGEGVTVQEGDFMCFSGKTVLASGAERGSVLCEAMDKIDLSDREIGIIICGKAALDWDTAAIERSLRQKLGCNGEVYILEGGQDIYDYIIVLE